MEQIQRSSDHTVHHVEVCYAARMVGVAASQSEHEWGHFSRTAPPPGEALLPPGFWQALERDFRDYDPSDVRTPTPEGVIRLLEGE